MKTFFACLMCLAFAADAASPDNNAATSKKTDGVQLVVDLLDGSRIIGLPEADGLKMKTQFATVEISLSLLRAIEFDDTDHTAHVTFLNGDTLAGHFAPPELSLKTSFARVSISLSLASRIRVVHLGGTFVNSLGMRFAPVPRTTVLFSIWDTRVEDYRLYAEANPGGDSNWKNPGFAREIDCPVVMVSWIEAKAFCAWLTQKERKEGRITQHQEYRLPTDKEWSAAVGNRKYPWGDQWPPPAGDAPILNGGSPSPVGSYSPNEYGLYDMGGNVWQWCEDWYQSGLNEQALLDKYPYLKDDGGGKTYRVDRGPALGATDPAMLSTSYRNRDPFGDHLINHGFRCVLAPVEAAPGSSATK